MPSLFVPSFHAREHMPEFVERRACHLHRRVFPMGAYLDKVRLFIGILQPTIEVRDAASTSVRPCPISQFGRPDQPRVTIISQEFDAQCSHRMHELLMCQRLGMIDARA